MMILLRLSVNIYLSVERVSTSYLYKLQEKNKIACLVKEDFLIKLLKPDLNRDSREILKLKALPQTIS